MGTYELPVKDYKIKPFKTFSKDWGLATAVKDGAVNTMTIRFATIGTLWRRNVVTVYVRPQRYTREFLDSSEYFSVTLFPEEYRKTLLYLGKTSGRDEDKISKSGLTLEYQEGIPYFKEAGTTILAKKIYQSDVLPENFIDPGILPSEYPNKDYHRVYVGEIVSILEKE